VIPQNTSRPRFAVLPFPWHRRLRSESGQSLVETALTLTLLLTLVFGIIEVSIALFSYHFISNAAREGTRYAIVRGATWGAACASYTSSGCTASTLQIQQYVASLSFPGINAANITVTPATSLTPGGSPCNPFSACNAASDVVQVQVTYTFPFSVPFVPQRTLTMSSTSQMVISQ
jgi:Flp pilus assembly protein TadG